MVDTMSEQFANELLHALNAVIHEYSKLQQFSYPLESPLSAKWDKETNSFVGVIRNRLGSFKFNIGVKEQ